MLPDCLAFTFRFFALLVLSFLACSLAAQTAAQKLAAQLEAQAALEDPRMGLDTRIRAADRLRLVDPAAATHLLESGIPLLSEPQGPSYYLAFRLMTTYASLDLDAAEKAGAKVADKQWVYNALIPEAAQAKDYSRVTRLVRQALKAGFFGLGGITAALSAMKRNVPEQAVALLRERIEAFPAETANASEIRVLLSTLAVFPDIDPPTAREALRRIFVSLDPQKFQNLRSEQTATYKIQGQEIKTDTTYETALLPSAAYLAVFDPEAYHKREASLPAWRASLAELRAADLPAIVRTNIVMRAQSLPVKSSAANSPAAKPQPAAYSSNFDEAIAAARELDPEQHGAALYGMLKRKDLTDE